MGFTSELEALRRIRRKRQMRKSMLLSLRPMISDRLAMEQVFSNLIDNALKYLRKDSQGRISVMARAQGGKIIVEIGDNGRGIERRDQTRVVELFRRAGVQDRPGEGHGPRVFGVSLPRTLVSETRRMSA